MSYILSIGLLLASAIYFIAANWQGFARIEKLGFSVSLLAFIYVLSTIFNVSFNRHKQLAAWLFMAGSLAFGASLALVGQIYNSHADSYILFLLWLIPSLGFAWVSKHPFYLLLSYVLFHLSYYFYFFPSAYTYYWDDVQRIFIFSALGLLNLLCYALVRHKVLQYVSFIVGILMLIWSTSTVHFTSSWIYVLNAFFIGYLLWQGYLLKRRHHNPMFIIWTILLSVYVFFRLIEWIVRYFHGDLVYFVIISLIVFLVFSVWVFKRIHSSLWKRGFVVVSSVVGTVILLLSVIGFFYMILDITEWLIYIILGLCMCVLAVLSFSRIPPMVGYTFLFAGLVVSLIPFVISGSVLGPLVLLIYGVCWVLSPSIYARILVYLFINIAFYAMLIEVMGIHELTAQLCLAAFNCVAYLLGRGERLKAYRLKGLSFFFFGVAMLAALMHSHPEWYIVIDAGYFIIFTALVYFYNKTHQTLLFWFSLGFWVFFLGVKYYDWLWLLLHKSIALLVLSILFLAVGLWLDRQLGEAQLRHLDRKSDQRHPFLSYLVYSPLQDENDGDVTDGRPGKLWRKVTIQKILIGALVILQFVILSMSIAVNVYDYRRGEEITLALAPIDPRSLLQGDYVILNYDISNIDVRNENIRVKDKVQLLLREDEQGFYTYANIYRHKGMVNRSYTPQTGDVWITGRYQGADRFTYGIETYFVPEGAGAEAERKRAAIVRVSENGNAILRGLK
ncbi:GDYXXLXY domain-containing protein [Caldalkalibacillus salinus]|uniref:GDYXXLXY domain-containing protein n=1 Tax=Caldalkalibacillus salinus TaxID=2803787 RepID=UPI001924F8AE|nr:GDYXXLXY domain-containing protein [Caldalkalibacillus salinus]